MYKEVLFITLLAAAASGFPAKGVEDLASAASEDKSPVPFKTDSGNPTELIEESAQLATNSRKTRGCTNSWSFNCRDEGVNPQDMFKHVENTQQNQYKGESDTRRDFLGFFGPYRQ